MAKNFLGEGDQISVVVTNPTTPASGDPVRFGNMTGVALTAKGEGGNAATYTTVHFDCGIFDLSVKAVDGNGNSAVAVGDAIFYVDADTPKLSKKTSGYFFGYALEAITSGGTDTINVKHVESPGSGTVAAGAVGTASLASGAVTPPKLSTNLAIGFIPLDISQVRIISSNAIQNTTEGGVPDGNTDPILQRVNGATDKCLRLVWAASSSVEVQFPPTPKPPDMDGTATLTVNLLVSKDTSTDNAVTIAVGIFDGIGDTNAGGNTAAIATASLTQYTVSMAAADLGDYPGMLNIVLTPGTHTTDAIRLKAAWIEYARRA